MPTIADKIIQVISKPKEQRTDFEIGEIIPWFRSKSQLFKSCKTDIIKEVIRNCGFRKLGYDDVIIKQGDNGDAMYIVLRGMVAIHVIADKDQSNEDILNQINHAVEKKKTTGLERQQLGNKVWQSGEGSAFGEIALLKEDCVRTASVIVDETSYFMEVDRALYNSSVRDVIENEFKRKNKFVDFHWLFKNWSPRHKKQMAISLRKEVLHYGVPIVRQGHPAERGFVILRGEVEVRMSPGTHKEQYPLLWEEMEEKCPFLIQREPVEEFGTAPHVKLRRRQNINRKSQNVCLMGRNEYVGFSEFLLQVDTYIQSAICTCDTEIISLTRDQFEKLFEKRYADALPRFREELAVRLNLASHRIENSPLLHFMLLKLQRPELIRMYGLRKARPKTSFHGKKKKREGNEDDDLRSLVAANRNDTRFTKLVNKLQNQYVVPGSCQPDSLTRNDKMVELETRLSEWLKATRVSARRSGRRAVSAVGVTEMRRFEISNVCDVPSPGNRINMPA